MSAINFGDLTLNCSCELAWNDLHIPTKQFYLCSDDSLTNPNDAEGTREDQTCLLAMVMHRKKHAQKETED